MGSSPARADSPRGAGDTSAEATFATYRGLVYDTSTIDGQYASMAGSVRVLFGPHAYAHAANEYRSNNADDSALDSLMRVAGGVRVSAHIPDPSSNDQDVIVAKDVGRRHAVAPIWEGVQLIVDEGDAGGRGRNRHHSSFALGWVVRPANGRLLASHSPSRVARARRSL